MLITFEGIEGSGKSTQVRLLADHLTAAGWPITVTREPGGTTIGDRIRGILLDLASAGMYPSTEALLFAASRAQHVAEKIRPALRQGRIVLCDRFADASRAYQRSGRGLPEPAIEQMVELAVEGLHPDLTVLLDLPVEEGLERARSRDRKRDPAAQGDRLEQEELDFHRRVRQGYLDLAEREPGRFRTFDSRLPKMELADLIRQAVAAALPVRPGGAA